MDHSRYLKFKTGALSLTLLVAIFSLTACSSSQVDDPNAPPPETAGDVAAAPDAKTDAVPVGEDPALAQQPSPGSLDAAGATPPTDVPPVGDPGAVADAPPAGDPSVAGGSPSDAPPAGDPGAVADASAPSAPLVDNSAPPVSAPVADVAPVTESAPVADAPVIADTSGGSGVSYKVRHGDTLMKIAFEQYGDLYRWKEIYEANRGRIKDPSNVPPGTSLTLNGSGMVTIERNGEQYLIKHGDTLGVISNDVYGTTHKWKKLWENNRQLIKDPNKIYAGFYLYYHPEARMTQDQGGAGGGSAANTPKNLPFKNTPTNAVKTAANTATKTVVAPAAAAVAPAVRAPASK